VRLRTAIGAGVAALSLAGCGGGAGKGTAKGIPIAEVAGERPEASLAEIRRAVAERLPAERYMTNAYLPEEGDFGLYAATGDREPRPVRVGMPWIFSDGFSPLYIGIDNGYFAEVGIAIEMVPGGPGKDHLKTLVGGHVDFAIVADGLNLPVFAASRTSGQVVGLASFLKKNPVAYLSLDPETPRDRRSQDAVEPADFVDSVSGVLRGRTHYVEFLVDAFDLDPQRVKVRWTGATPDALIAGVVDHWAAWILDQPRLLERSGYRNWRAFRFHDLGWRQYCDVVVARRETTRQDPELVRRFLAALERATRFYFENPEASAAIASRYATDTNYAPEDVLRRYEFERPIVRGDDGLPLLHMDSERWNDVAALLVKYGLIEPGVVLDRDSSES